MVVLRRYVIQMQRKPQYLSSSSQQRKPNETIEIRPLYTYSKCKKINSNFQLCQIPKRVFRPGLCNVVVFPPIVCAPFSFVPKGKSHIIGFVFSTGRPANSSNRSDNVVAFWVSSSVSTSSGNCTRFRVDWNLTIFEFFGVRVLVEFGHLDRPYRSDLPHLQ